MATSASPPMAKSMGSLTASCPSWIVTWGAPPKMTAVSVSVSVPLSIAVAVVCAARRV
jgi:hypothetical protein